MGEGCACGGKCGPDKKGPNRTAKYALLAFVALSVAAAVYKIAAAPCCAGNTSQAAAVEAVPAAAPAAAASKKTAEKAAVVYYFYTNTRCSSCQMIEAYTKEAVEKNFKTGYKSWSVVFKGVNIEEAPNRHFVEAYQLDSKSVIVQKFSGDKSLKWGKLPKVWELTGDKEAFLGYVAAETRRQLDEK